MQTEKSFIIFDKMEINFHNMGNINALMPFAFRGMKMPYFGLNIISQLLIPFRFDQSF